MIQQILSQPIIKKEGKWIIVENKDKKVRFRRSSKQGIILESCMNNKDGVRKELLEVALMRKEAVPVTEGKEVQSELAKKWRIEEIEKMANLQSRALTLLTNGKIYIEINADGLRLNVPSYLKDGFECLMDLVNPEDAEKRKSVRGEKLKRLNHFFCLCKIDIKGIEENDGVSFQGGGVKQLVQFMKSCAGYKLPKEKLFQDLF